MWQCGVRKPVFSSRKNCFGFRVSCDADPTTHFSARSHAKIELPVVAVGELSPNTARECQGTTTPVALGWFDLPVYPMKDIGLWGSG